VSKFTPKKYSQQQLTKILFSVTTNPSKQSLVELHSIVWKNPNNPDSLHLSTAGWAIVVKLQMTVYKYKYQETLTGKLLLQLDRYLQGPFHIYGHGRHLAILDEQDHIMLELHAGDLATFLDNLEKFS
jgi:hypothetical protein